MKKILYFALAATISSAALSSCETTREEVVQVTDNDTYPVAYELNGLNLVRNSSTGDYEVVKEFAKPLTASDVVLVYRAFDVDKSGNKMYQQLPRIAYSNLGNLDYDFYFSKLGLVIRAKGNYELNLTPQFINNQTFRVVFVPASTGKNANVDYSDYYSVAKFYNIKESDVIKK